MSERISRRSLTVAALAVPAAAQRPKHKYRGALEHQASKVNMNDFDPVVWTLDRYRSAPLRMTFRATTRAEAERWQKELRAKVTDLLGGFPDRTALQYESLETRELPTYTREKFVFQSRPGSNVLGYLLMPRA